MEVLFITFLIEDWILFYSKKSGAALSVSTDEKKFVYSDQKYFDFYIHKNSFLSVLT